MNDFLGRQAGRLLGVMPIVQPVVASRFAQGPELLSDTSGDWLEQTVPAQAPAVSAPRLPTPAAPGPQPAFGESDTATSAPTSAGDIPVLPPLRLLEETSPGDRFVTDDQRYSVPPDPVDGLTTAGDVLSQSGPSPQEIDTLECDKAVAYEGPLSKEPGAGQTTPESTVESSFKTGAPAGRLSNDNDRSAHEPGTGQQSRSELTAGRSPGTPGRVDYPQTDFQQETPEGIPDNKATQPPSTLEVTPSFQVGQPVPGESTPQSSFPPDTGPSVVPSAAGPRDLQGNALQEDSLPVGLGQNHKEPGWAQPAEAPGLTDMGTPDKLSVAGTQESSEGVESPENSGDGPGTPEQHSPNPVEAIDPIPRMRQVASLQQSGLPDLSPPPTRSQQIPGDGTSTTQGTQSPGIPAESLTGITDLSPDSESTAPGTQEVSSKQESEEGQVPVIQRQTSLQPSSSLESARRPEFDEPPTGPSSRQRAEVSGEAPVADLSRLTPALEVAADRGAQISGPETSPRIGTDGPSNQEERVWSQVSLSPDRGDSPASTERGGELQNVPQPESTEFIMLPGLFTGPKPETSANAPDTGIPGLPTPFEGVVDRQCQAPESETSPRTTQDRPSNQGADPSEISSVQDRAGTPPIEKEDRSPEDTAQARKSNELTEHLSSQSSIKNVSRQPFPLQPMSPEGRPSKGGVPAPSDSFPLEGSDGRSAGNRSSAGSGHIYQPGQPEALPMMNGTDEGQEGGTSSTQVPLIAEERSGPLDEVIGPMGTAPLPPAQEGLTSPARMTGTEMPDSRGRATNSGLGPEGLSDSPDLPVGYTGPLEHRRDDSRQGDVPEPTDQPIQRQAAPPAAVPGAFTTPTGTPATPSVGTPREGPAGPALLPTDVPIQRQVAAAPIAPPASGIRQLGGVETASPGESSMVDAPFPVVDSSNPADINRGANNQQFGRGLTQATTLPVGAGPSGHTPNRSSEVPGSDHNSLTSPAPDRPDNPPMPLSGDSISASADVSHNDAGHQSDSGGPELVANVPRRWQRAGSREHLVAAQQTGSPDQQDQAFQVTPIPGDSGLGNYLETRTRATRPGRPAEQNTPAGAPSQSDSGSGSPTSPGSARTGNSINGGASGSPMQSPEESSADLLPQGRSELDSSLQRPGLVQSPHDVPMRPTDRSQEPPSSPWSNGPFWRPPERELSRPPTTRVNIGRIEVRATTPPELSPAPKPPRPDPRLTLDEYLKRRDGKQS
jgi:hypothetical protein